MDQIVRLSRVMPHVRYVRKEYLKLVIIHPLSVLKWMQTQIKHTLNGGCIVDIAVGIDKVASVDLHSIDSAEYLGGSVDDWHRCARREPKDT